MVEIKKDKDGKIRFENEPEERINLTGAILIEKNEFTAIYKIYSKDGIWKYVVGELTINNRGEKELGDFKGFTDEEKALAEFEKQTSERMDEIEDFYGRGEE